MFKEFIKENYDNIINTTSELIKFNSVSEETENKDMPFGKECKDVLDYTLNLAKNMGFRTKNIDGYCGYIEFGEGEELIGIIGHLDVVPADINDGWTSSPFEATIRNDKLYGRGSIDDKGPVVSSLYAMKAVLEKCKIKKRVRLILGLNEEKSWKCINRYKETEEIPSMGFSPDANFPAIYAEKGILSILIKNEFSLDNFEIIETDCMNNALNVVPKYSSITLRYVGNGEMPNFETEENIEIQKLDNTTVKIIARGIASHSAHPELGNNAITNLVKYLLKYFKNEYLQTLLNLGIFEIESPEFLSRKDIGYATEFNEMSVIQDESGILTSNVARFDYEDGSLSIKINLRVPVKTNLDDIVMQYKKLVNIFENISVEEIARQDALYVEKDSFLVTKLVDIYNKATCTKKEPIAIGGGTYARAFPNCIAYGPTMPNTKDMCHQVDEYIEVKTLMLATEIYAEAIYELAK
jgi:succinyl-diaminopimelate desuccinylase